MFISINDLSRMFDITINIRCNCPFYYNGTNTTNITHDTDMVIYTTTGTNIGETEEEVWCEKEIIKAEEKRNRYKYFVKNRNKRVKSRKLVRDKIFF